MVGLYEINSLINIICGLQSERNKPFRQSVIRPSAMDNTGTFARVILAPCPKRAIRFVRCAVGACLLHQNLAALHKGGSVGIKPGNSLTVEMLSGKERMSSQLSKCGLARHLH